MNNGKPCGKPLYDSERCIFHSSDMERKREAFGEAFWEEFERQKSEKKGFDFEGYIFPDSIDFGDKKLVGTVCFAKTVFSGKVDFNSTIFEGNADFSKAMFNADAFFRFAAFENQAVFNAATFSGKAAFTKAIFTKGAEFVLSEFRRDTDFNAAVFSGNANFNDAAFAWEADFSTVTVKNDINFENVAFSGTAKFMNAKYLGIAAFDDAEFSGEASFRNTKFDGILSFSRVHSAGTFDFSYTKSTRVDFSNTTFSGETHFRQSKFSKGGNFNRAKFLEDASFSSVEFLNEKETGTDTSITFKEAEFFDQTDFSNGKFHGKTIDFSKTKFKGKIVDFQGAEFKGHFVNFIETQFSGEEARFTGCGFDEVDKVSLSGAYFNNVIGLFEELEKEKNYLFFLKRYRYLFDDFSFRLGSESAGRYPIIAGGVQEYWHYENLKKKYPLFYWFLRVSTDLNKSIFRFLLCCIFIIISFAVIYHGCFYCSEPSGFEAKYIEPSCPFISFVYFSAVTFTTLGFGDIIPRDGWLQLVITIEVILGYMMLGLLINLIASFLYSRKS
jgi:hypothetical protein